MYQLYSWFTDEKSYDECISSEGLGGIQRAIINQNNHGFGRKSF